MNIFYQKVWTIHDINALKPGRLFCEPLLKMFENSKTATTEEILEKSDVNFNDRLYLAFVPRALSVEILHEFAHRCARRYPIAEWELATIESEILHLNAVCNELTEHHTEEGYRLIREELWAIRCVIAEHTKQASNRAFSSITFGMAYPDFLPKVYEEYQIQIDDLLEIIREHKADNETYGENLA